MSYRPVAWAYMADYHCPECADDADMARDGAEDGEGNEPTPVMEWDSWWSGDDGCEFLHCGTCGEFIDAAHAEPCGASGHEDECRPSWDYVTAAEEAYEECALWTEEEALGDAQIMPEQSAELVAAVEPFIEANWTDVRHLTPEQVGHDFWLTRNRHGAGFWDRGLGRVGDDLTDAAHVYGEQYLYVGDDGRIYVS